MTIDLILDREYDPPGVVYLASPYNHSDWLVRDKRWREICKVASRLMGMEICVYSPIAHNHHIALCAGLKPSWEFWERYDTAMLKLCSELWVCKLDGWDKSVGIAAEIEIALANNKPIRYLDVHTFVLQTRIGDTP